MTTSSSPAPFTPKNPKTYFSFPSSFSIIFQLHHHVLSFPNQTNNYTTLEAEGCWVMKQWNRAAVVAVGRGRRWWWLVMRVANRLFCVEVLYHFFGSFLFFFFMEWDQDYENRIGLAKSTSWTKNQISFLFNCLLKTGQKYDKLVKKSLNQQRFTLLAV